MNCNLILFCTLARENADFEKESPVWWWYRSSFDLPPASLCWTLCNGLRVQKRTCYPSHFSIVDTVTPYSYALLPYRQDWGGGVLRHRKVSWIILWLHMYIQDTAVLHHIWFLDRWSKHRNWIEIDLIDWLP